MTKSSLTRWVPVLFVFLWSTGFIGAKFSLPWIEPFNLLFVRMLITIVVFLGLILWFKAKWPTPKAAMHQMVVGSLIHAAYLGGVFAAIKWQMPAGIVALIVGLQPLLTALLAWVVINDRLNLKQWFGMGLGAVGLAMVLLPNQTGADFNLSWAAIAGTIVALIGISIGTLYQKRFGTGTDPLTGSLFQYIATAAWMGLLTSQFETQEIIWHPHLIGGLLWLVFGLSVTAILLLMYMIRQGSVAKVASYFYLVPAVTMLEAWLLFDETLTSVAIGGMLLVLVAVYLVTRSPQPTGAETNTPKSVAEP